MRTFFMLAFSGMLALGVTSVALAQDNAPPPQGTREALQRIHGPQSIDQQLDRLTKDLELTADQRIQVRQLLVAHHDEIQALLDKNPTLERQALAPQIHAI